MVHNSTALDDQATYPSHIAIIMDGNGRWAKKRKLPRFVGHQKGLDALEKVVVTCLKQRVRYLTVFAFSTENWRRPQKEVDFLMGLFSHALEQKIKELHKYNIRFRFIGRRDRLRSDLLAKISASEALTADNRLLTVTVAADYGGRWDITQALECLKKTGEEVSEETISRHLSLADLPNPQLFIRTGGEQRLSNFLLWQIAYTEIYFSDTLWPDFAEEDLKAAVEDYQGRERRFGRISEPLEVD